MTVLTKESKRRLSRGIRKYLRKRKAHIRQSIKDPREAERAVLALWEQFRLQ